MPTLPPRSRAKGYIHLLRPIQIYKTLIVLLPSLFHGGNALGSNLPRLAWAMLDWAFASALVYVLNDILDRGQDRLNPSRCHRPLADGTIGVPAASVLAALLTAALALLLHRGPADLVFYIYLYLVLNLGYSLGLKRQVGLRQLLVALGFWLRLKSGAAPVVPVPLTLWASIFTLGLAYHLNCLKGLGTLGPAQDRLRTTQQAAAVLAGGLALVALTSLCLKRGLEGTLALPELPPLFCLVALHRGLLRASEAQEERDQARTLFLDPVILACILGFCGLFLLG